LLKQFWQKVQGKIGKENGSIATSDRPKANNLIQQYIDNGRIPWSAGYKPYRIKLLQQAVTDEKLLETFRRGETLPRNYGFGIDERIVEYPWVLSRLNTQPSRLLDAGSTLNYPYLLDLPQLAPKSIIIMTLAPEHLEKRANVSYLYGDLRDIIIRDRTFESIVCISTLEHIGLDNSIYTDDSKYQETSAEDYRQVLSELRRVLAPGGRLLLTVPFGLKQNFGWMQQFDAAGLTDIVAAFGSEPIDTTFFQYLPQGWIISDREACSQCEYYNIHSTPEPPSDRAAAARAVACLEFVSDSQ
jgi:SAM-dependent methyltransferase